MASGSPPPSAWAGGRTGGADARGADKLAYAAEQVRAAGAPQTLTAVCDVGDEAAVAALIDCVIAQLGALHILVNNAGVLSTEPLVKFTGKDWQRVLDVDLIGAVYCSKHALMRMGPGGAIVNVSSIHAFATASGIGPCAASKTAVVSLTRTIALEGRDKGIRANAVLPVTCSPETRPLVSWAHREEMSHAAEPFYRRADHCRAA